MHLLYFGWDRSKIGTDRETIEIPDGVTDVKGLITWLRDRGKGYAEALAEPLVVRVAVNQELADLDQPVTSSDEIAVFPPMTGG